VPAESKREGEPARASGPRSREMRDIDLPFLERVYRSVRPARRHAETHVRAAASRLRLSGLAAPARDRLATAEPRSRVHTHVH